MLQVDLYTRDVPEIFTRFSDLIGERHWTRRAAAIKSEGKGRPHLREYLLDENAIAIALDKASALASRYGTFPMQHINDREFYPAFRLAAQTLSVVVGAEPDQRKRVVRRLHGAFKNPDDMRAIQLEFGVATHFVRRGLSISWPEMDDSGTFDLMVHGIGPDGLEVECKSVSNDRGRKIHRRDAIEFNHLVRQGLEPLANRLRSGLAVVLTVPDRLPKTYLDRKALADLLTKAVIAGRSTTLGDGSDVRLLEFSIGDYPSLGPPMSPQLRADVDSITGTRNREVMLVGRRKAGAVVFAVQSLQDDPLIAYIFNTVDEAARSQLTKGRAGMVLVGMDGLSAAELASTARQDKNPNESPTVLRREVSKFLGGDSTSNVVGVGFLSRDEFGSGDNGQVTSGGIAYHFPKRESRFWHIDFDGLFVDDEATTP